MTPILRFCLSILVICAALWPTLSKAQGITFRNTEFRFRFVYPTDWSQKTPRGPNVRALVDAPDGASNCNVVVRRTPDLEKSSQKEIDAAVFAATMSEADWKEMIGDKFPDLKFIERRLTKVDNRPAQFAVTEMTYTTIAATVSAIQMQFITMTPGLFWSFGCMAGGTSSRTANINFQKMRPAFIAILSSFVFER